MADNADELRTRIQKGAKLALDIWGEHQRWSMVQEECAELIAEISHWRRGRVTDEVVAGEVADVFILVMHARYLLQKRGVNLRPILLGKLLKLEQEMLLVVRDQERMYELEEERERDAQHARALEEEKALYGSGEE